MGLEVLEILVVEILVETKFINNKCLHKRLGLREDRARELASTRHLPVKELGRRAVRPHEKPVLVLHARKILFNSLFIQVFALAGSGVGQWLQKRPP